jgi:hypothetical protein
MTDVFVLMHESIGWVCETRNCKLLTNNCALQTVGCGLWAVGCGLWAVGCGLWAVGFILYNRVCNLINILNLKEGFRKKFYG